MSRRWLHLGIWGLLFKPFPTLSAAHRVISTVKPKLESKHMPNYCPQAASLPRNLYRAFSHNHQQSHRLAGPNVRLIPTFLAFCSFRSGIRIRVMRLLRPHGVQRRRVLGLAISRHLFCFALRWPPKGPLHLHAALRRELAPRAADWLYYGVSTDPAIRRGLCCKSFFLFLPLRNRIWVIVGTSSR